MKTFEDGYRACWGRVSDAGYDLVAHSFKNYLIDLEKAFGRDGAGSSNKPNDAAE